VASVYATVTQAGAVASPIISGLITVAGGSTASLANVAATVAASNTTNADPA
jgi:acyl-coenzyme A thioesterase PaaI-like protein